MIRVYIVAVDSLNPLRPAFANLPTKDAVGGVEIFEEALIPSPQDLAQAVADCVEIARTGQALPKPEPAPKLTSDDRPGELDVPDPRLVADAASWDATPDLGDAPSYDERFADLPDNFD